MKGKQNMCECALQGTEVIVCGNLDLRTAEEQGQTSRSPYLEVVTSQLIISD